MELSATVLTLIPSRYNHPIRKENLNHISPLVLFPKMKRISGLSLVIMLVLMTLFGTNVTYGTGDKVNMSHCDYRGYRTYVAL